MHISRPKSKQPIPNHAKLVFHGILFDAYQWQQTLFDGTTTTFEKLKRNDTVNVIPVTTEGKIILSKQEQPGVEPFIGTFGGVIDTNESPLDAAERELHEEAGFKAAKFVLFDAVQLIDKIDWALYTFIAKGCEKVSQQHLDPGEKIELLFVSFDEFLHILTQENFRDTEIAIRLLRLKTNQKKFKNIRELFS